SIQGESSFVGLSCYFIRLAGCNLRCRYCDTPQAWESGREMDISELVSQAAASPAQIVEITGGEPLLQAEFTALATALRDKVNRPVLVETNGSLDISRIPTGVIAVMDVKCPSSGMLHTFDMANLERLRPVDEVKFVICNRSDYDWAREFIERHKLRQRCREVIFSPATGRINPRRLAEWMMEDCPPARLQVRLHTLIGMK
ncbi:MAG: radical SAM protein, partial [Kiritimatiellae bacterium]|nr:radical SAM protein [Kiritimatiellia bacterium]